MLESCLKPFCKPQHYDFCISKIHELKLQASGSLPFGKACDKLSRVDCNLHNPVLSAISLWGLRQVENWEAPDSSQDRYQKIK